MAGTGRNPDDDAGGDAADGSSAAPTIYDVARVAGVSIASVSRVLNRQRNPRRKPGIASWRRSPSSASPRTGRRGR